VVAGAVLLGKVTVKGYGFGMVASAIIVGAALSAWASTYGIKMSLDSFAKALFYYLFMYGGGLRVSPSRKVQSSLSTERGSLRMDAV